MNIKIIFLLLIWLNPNFIIAQISISKKDATCGEKNGRITVTVNEGTPPYTYIWSNGKITQTIRNLSGGTYSVTIFDANGCSGDTTVTITGSPAVRVSISGSASLEYCQGEEPPKVTLTASASGGFPPLSLTWTTKTVSSTGHYCVTARDALGCRETACVDVIITPIDCSKDPNDIVGPPGYGEAQWVSINEDLNYTVRFENDPEFATAPAQRVEINHSFDPVANPFSFRLGSFGFGNMNFNVPPNSTFYSKRLDATDSLGIFVDVVAGINVTENKAFWIFESIDPATGLPPLDAQLGMLPVNDSIFHRGEGYVNFSVTPKSTSQTGDTIKANAVITFDINEDIGTNTVFNVIDALPPSSDLQPQPPVNPNNEITLNWSGQDDPEGSGLREYDVYVSANSAPFTVFQAGLAETSTTYAGEPGVTYSFYTRASDQTGNLEPEKTGEFLTVTIGNAFELAAEVLLQGPYNPETSLMKDDLRGLSLIPLTEPYSGLGYVQVNSGGETIDPSVLATTGNDAIVDWVFIALRDKFNATQIVRTKSALLQRDGDIVDLDGISLLTFNDLASDEYFVTVYHRNHLPVSTAFPQSFGNGVTEIDFASSQVPAFGDYGQYEHNSLVFLWSGDANGDGSIVYEGYGSDVEAISNVVLSAPANTGQSPTLPYSAYHTADLNMDGKVIFAGAGTDVNFISAPVFLNPGNFNHSSIFVVEGQKQD